MAARKTPAAIFCLSIGKRMKKVEREFAICRHVRAGGMRLEHLCVYELRQ